MMDEFIEKSKNNPSIVAHASKTLLHAIESSGRREVTENGETIERYRFFDNPSEDGKHAIVGNSKQLNALVDSIRSMAKGFTNDFPLLMINGPTGCGKSELKKCIMSEMEHYSKEDDSMYTVEFDIGDDNWKRSPVRVNPLTLKETPEMDEILSEIDENNEQKIKSRVLHDLDPFSKECLNKIDDKEDIRVVECNLTKGDGLGVIKSEDEGTPREKLVGNWIDPLPTNEIRGTRDPFGFSYEGLLCQGNNGVSFIEEGLHNIQMIIELVDFIDEGEVKIDNNTWIDVDTVLFVIAREKIHEKLEEETDDYDSIERRMRKYKINYLSDYNLESNLQRKMLKGGVSEKEPKDALFIENVVDDELSEKEIAPHGIEMVAVFNVMTRTGDSLREVMKGDTGRARKDGLPPTFSRDIMSDFLSRRIEDRGLDLEDVITPTEILTRLKEESEYGEEAEDCMEYIDNVQESEFIDSIMENNKADREDIIKYVKNVFRDSSVGKEDAEVDKDYMREFEVNKLGISEYTEYAGSLSENVKKFRDNKVADPLTKMIEGREFKESKVDINKLSFTDDLLSKEGWEDIKRVHTKLDLDNWEDPPEYTQDVKEKTKEVMSERYGYTMESAEVITRKIAREMEDKWRDIEVVEWV
jgi:non-specific serine/threonine protein kinase